MLETMLQDKKKRLYTETVFALQILVQHLLHVI